MTNYLKIGAILACVFGLTACSNTPADSISTNTATNTLPTVSNLTAVNLNQVIEINGLKVAFPSQWSISTRKGEGVNAVNESVWDIANVVAGDEKKNGVIWCPMDTIEGYDNPNDIREQRALTKGSTTYDIELNILNQRTEIEPWIASILLSKKDANLQDKNNSCSINFFSDNAFTVAEKELYQRIYQAIQ